MRIRRLILYTAAVVLVIIASIVTAAATGPVADSPEELGKRVFFDTNLSSSKGQSCASCHDPEAGFAGPTSFINATTAVYPGAVHTRFGNRKPPTAAYGGFSPVLSFDGRRLWIGGMFWDGRATGERLGDPLAEQAQGPFLNPVEQNLPSATKVVQRVCNGTYGGLFREVCGEAACAT